MKLEVLADRPRLLGAVAARRAQLFGHPSIFNALLSDRRQIDRG